MDQRTLTIPTEWNPLDRFEWREQARIPAWAWIVLLWAMFVFPAISLRSFHYEEGNIVGIARSAIEDHRWLEPHLYGLRNVERPSLMSWIIAVLGILAGGNVNQWVARAPAVLSLLSGCLLVFFLVRRYVSELAALFATLCFIASPMVLQKVVVAEADVLVSVILFAAFVVWWNGVEAGAVSFLRWFSLGAILALAALCKGPHPLAYFGLGIGAFHLLRRQWLHIAGLAVAGIIAGLISGAWYWAVYQPGDIQIWMAHSRLHGGASFWSWVTDCVSFVGFVALETLPALILVAPFALIVSRPGTSKSNDLVIALLLYASCCTAALVFWPDARGRYAMPAILALAAVAGLAFERYRVERPKLVHGSLGVGVILATYQIVLSWLIMPSVPEAFERTRNAARIVSAAVTAQPAPLYVLSESLNKNLIAYVREPMRVVTMPDLRTKPQPAWVLATPALEQRLRELLPDLSMSTRVVLDSDETLHLLELRPR